MHHGIISEKSEKLLKEYSPDVIHVHTIPDYFKVKNTLNKLNLSCKVWMTIRSPESGALEDLDKWLVAGADKEKAEEIFRLMELAEAEALKGADFLVFQSIESTESLRETIKNFDGICGSKMGFVPTGVRGLNATLSKNQAKKYFGIPEDSCCIVFVGRYNEVKCYPYIIDARNNFLKDNSVYILVAGNKKRGGVFNYK